MFAPPSARRNFLKYAPLTCNPGSAPERGMFFVFILFKHELKDCGEFNGKYDTLPEF